MKKGLLQLKLVNNSIIKGNNAIKEVPSKYGYKYTDLQRICVYFHYYDDEEKPFYIGQGTINRAFNFLQRNKCWKDKVKDVSKVKVEIKHVDISVEESIKLEKEYIEKYGRLWNNTGCLVNYNEGDTAIGNKKENNYFYNKHLYKELNGNYRNKYDKNPLSIPIVQIDILGNVVKHWSSAREAAEKANFEASCISACCNGKRHIHKGYQWMYEANYDNTINYEYKPGKTNKAIIIRLDVYNNYIKTYYDNDELLKDGFVIKNVQQVTSGYKKSHRGSKFINFFRLSKEDKIKYIDKIDTTKCN